MTLIKRARVNKYSVAIVTCLTNMIILYRITHTILNSWLTLIKTVCFEHPVRCFTLITFSIVYIWIRLTISNNLMTLIIVLNNIVNSIVDFTLITIILIWCRILNTLIYNRSTNIIIFCLKISIRWLTGITHKWIYIWVLITKFNSFITRIKIVRIIVNSIIS